MSMKEGDWCTQFFRTWSADLENVRRECPFVFTTQLQFAKNYMDFPHAPPKRRSYLAATFKIVFGANCCFSEEKIARVLAFKSFIKII